MSTLPPPPSAPPGSTPNQGTCQYLEGPLSTWKDHNRDIGVQKDKDLPIVVLPGTDWSFQVLTAKAQKKGVWKYFLFLGEQQCMINVQRTAQSMTYAHDLVIPS